MLGATEKKPGRPRGSGKSATSLVLEVPRPESVPFLAGMRVYDAYPLFNESAFATLALVSPFLTQAERRAITPMGDDRYRKWLVAGYIYGAMLAALDEARQA